MKNITPQSIARQNNCRNASPASSIASQAGMDNGHTSWQAERQLLWVRLSRVVAINKNPDRYSDRGFSLLRFSSLPYQSLRFAQAMMLMITINHPALAQKTALSGAR